MSDDDLCSFIDFVTASAQALASYRVFLMFSCVSMFQICSWNVRDLNDLGKRGVVKFVVSKFRICALSTRN